jgi:hypothetical protein
LQDRFDRPPQARLGELEEPGDAQLRRVGPDQFAGAAFAEKESEGREEERLAGAGFAGPGAKPRLEFDANVLDEGHVLNGKFAQHKE